ncbi:MAG: hypothetical protein HQL86_07335 [Magnetococcales bacterium]|nr:hypothetical protein [Magnetococcales bacterium]
MAAPHLWLALSPHGYGHAAMTAPVVAELRRRIPDLRLTVQTTVDRAFLDSRYQSFAHVAEIADFGFRMRSSTCIDLDASARGYRELHRDFSALVAREAERLSLAAPDLVLANIPYVTLAAAARAGIPAVAMSSLNWADMYAHYLGDRPEADEILGQIRAAYAAASVFLRCRPAQTMTVLHQHDIDPVVVPGQNRRPEVATALGISGAVRLGLIAFGGIGHPLPLERWPLLPGWVWLTSQEPPPGRDDFRHWQAGGIAFCDLSASVDLIVTKPGYGTFTEAGIAGIPVLFVPRPDWPESPHLDDWLAIHTRCLPIETGQLFDGSLPAILHTLFSLPIPSVAGKTGISEAASVLQRILTDCDGSC